MYLLLTLTQKKIMLKCMHMRTLIERVLNWQPTIPTPEIEVTPTHRALLQHLFLNINLSGIQTITKGKRLTKNTEIAFNESNSVHLLLELLRKVMTEKTNQKLKIRLYLTDKEEDLLANLQKYIPIDSPEIQSNVPFSQNNVHELMNKGERTNKIVQISAYDLASYLIKRHNIPPEKARIQILANVDISVFILGTVRDNVPQSVIFFAGVSNIKSQPIEDRSLKRQVHRRTSGALSPT